MRRGNDTQFSGFLLLGLSKEPEPARHIWAFPIHVPDHCAWKPAYNPGCQIRLMYFFLSNQSFVDICFTSTTIPRMLWNIQTKSKGITYEGCITQMYFSILFVCWDNFLLALMVCVHFFTICHPLHYNIILNPQLCGLLMLVSWISSVLSSLLQSLMMWLSSVQTWKYPTFSVIPIRCSHCDFGTQENKNLSLLQLRL